MRPFVAIHYFLQDVLERFEGQYFAQIRCIAATRRSGNAVSSNSRHRLGQISG